MSVYFIVDRTNCHIKIGASGKVPHRLNEGIAILDANTAPEDLQSCMRMLLNEGVTDTYELARSLSIRHARNTTCF
jgi:hypothetical protein